MKKLNLCEILKNYIPATELYSPVYGYVYLSSVENKKTITFPICVKTKDGNIHAFTSEGKLFTDSDAECCLFPSKENRNWNTFKSKREVFNPKTLKPFDKVLVRDMFGEYWSIGLFDTYFQGEEFPFACLGDNYKYCVPYNKDTKYLLGTCAAAPKYYRIEEEE